MARDMQGMLRLRGSQPQVHRAGCSPAECFPVLRGRILALVLNSGEPDVYTYHSYGVLLLLCCLLLILNVSCLSS